MTPEQMSRDAMRIVDRVEATTVKRLLAFIRLIEADTRDLLRGLELRDTSRSRVFQELRARQAVEQSVAARRLLSLGRAEGPLANEFRVGIRGVFEDGVRTARNAAISTGVVTTTEAFNALAFGSRVDLDFLEALTRTTITTLDKVSVTGVQRLSDAIARGAVRGAGPRATARLAREAVELTRYEAERITRTVFARSNNEARDQTLERLGVQYVQWDATNDTRTCAYCEARHGVVWKIAQAPAAPAHPSCRCVHLCWNPDTPPEVRQDDYYRDTRSDMAARREGEGRKPSTSTAAAPFDRLDGVKVPPPVWAPGRGWI